MLSEQQLLELGIDAERKANLLKLRDHLKTVPQEKFFMGAYLATGIGDQDLYSPYRNFKELTLDKINPVEVLHTCGSVSCAIGLGPTAGIPVGDSLTWRTYSMTNFVACNSILSGKADDFLFRSGWKSIDPTPMGVAKRIDILLEKGLECWPTGELSYFKDNLPYETE